MKRETCPYLGLKDDPTTILNFPSQGNFCHQARPIASVKATYQEKYCLTQEHVTCPLYNAAHPVPLPPALAVKSGPVFTGRQVAALVGVPSVVVAVAALAYGWNAFGRQMLSARSVPNTGSDNGDADFGLVGAPTQPNHTPVSANQSNDSTVTPTASCPRPADWVTYTVNPTDSLYRLSVIYGVSVDDLQKANCMGSNTVILPGQVIYVPFIPTNTPVKVNTPVPQVVLPKATNTFTQAPPPPAPAATATQVPPTSLPPTITAPPPSSTPAPTTTATSLPPTATGVPLPTATTPPLPTITVPPAPTTPPPTDTPLPPPTATVQPKPTRQHPPRSTATSQPLSTATSPVSAPTNQPAPTATALIIPSATAITTQKAIKTPKPKKIKP